MHEDGMSEILRKSSKNQFLVVVLLAITAASTFYTSRNFFRIGRVHAQIHAAPFYLDKMVFTVDAKGKLSISRREILARRSDGTTMRSESVGPVDLARFLRKVVFPDGRSVTMADSIKAKSTWPAMATSDLEIWTSRITSNPPDCGARKPYSVIKFDKQAGVDVVVV